MTEWDRQHILVTRPSHQAQGLIAALTLKGASVLLFPTLTIKPVDNQDTLTQTVSSIVDFDWYIFISPNAVNYALPLLIKAHGLDKLRGQFAAVGAGTADQLADFGVKNATYPLTGVGAQALLDSLKYENFKDKKIAIFKGNSHNQTLEDALTKQGAIIQDVDCYQRLRTQDDPTPLVHALDHHHLNMIVTTSGDGLRHLVDIIPENIQSKLFDLPVVVVSERVESMAKDYGFKKILLADNASDEAIVSVIDQWYKQGETHV